jgi:hypothetical protein
MTNNLRTSRAIDAEQHTTAAAFGAVRTIAPNIADRLDEATIQLAAAEDDLAYANEKLRRLHPPSVFRDEIPGKRRIDFDLDMDEIERRVAIADLEREQVETSRRVKDTRKHVEAVRQEAANVLLHRGGADWQERAATMVAARGDVERNFARFVGSLMIYAEAVNAERAAARTVQAIARQALAIDEARDALLFAAKTGEVPVAINDDGFADTVDRPELGLYGDETIDFGSLARLLELAFTDPERAAKQLNGTTLGNAIRKQTR